MRFLLVYRFLDTQNQRKMARADEQSMNLSSVDDDEEGSMEGNEVDSSALNAISSLSHTSSSQEEEKKEESQKQKIKKEDVQFLQTQFKVSKSKAKGWLTRCDNHLNQAIEVGMTDFS